MNLQELAFSFVGKARNHKYSLLTFHLLNLDLISFSVCFWMKLIPYDDFCILRPFADRRAAGEPRKIEMEYVKKIKSYVFKANQYLLARMCFVMHKIETLTFAYAYACVQVCMYTL